MGNFVQYFSRPKQLNFSDITTSFDLKEVNYNNGSLKIIGSFSGIYSVETTNDITSGITEIKDGKFKIIF